MNEKDLDFLYWVLVDYCESNTSDIKEQAKINRIFKKIVKLANKEGGNGTTTQQTLPAMVVAP